MKASRVNIARLLDQPDEALRLYLFHGPDEAQSRANGARLLQALGADRFIVISNLIKADPATLADEAGALALFGGRRVIWIEPAGEEIVAGVEALLEANETESPVVAIAGNLRKTSALLKLAEGSPKAVAYASYAPEGEAAERMVIDIGRRFGLKIGAPVAARVAAACGNDRAIVTQELDKLGLYLDASPNAPRELDHDALDAVGADLDEGEILHLADLALAGDMQGLADALARLGSAADAIPVVRSLQRRLLALAPARARLESGQSASDVMASIGKSLFWKDKPVFEKLLKAWCATDVQRLYERSGELERDLLFSPAPALETLGEELVAVARVARKR
ncbi:MAG TPA: DNA polymerase III subunit delta [Sphingomicrobium sp.]|nr:DNA polymerase III subunit delta [Sphingomicrobium sp.]